MEKVPWDVGRGMVEIRLSWGLVWGVRGRERGNAKKTCFLAGRVV